MSKKQKVLKDNQIFEQGILIQWDIGKWGATARLPKELLQDLPPEVVRGMQDLVTPEDKTLIKQLSDLRNEAYFYIRSETIPFPVNGFTFVYKKRIEEIDEKLTDIKVRYFLVVEDILNSIEDMESNFKDAYPDLYRKELYPNRKCLERKFRFDWNFVLLSVPDGESGILTKEMYKREVDKFKEQFKGMREETMNIVADEFLLRLNNLRKQCVNGKPSRRTINGLNSLIEKYDDLWRGFCSTKDLRVQIEKVRKQIGNLDVDLLKDKGDKQYKKKVKGQVTKIMKSIKNVPDVRLKRKLDI